MQEDRNISGLQEVNDPNKENPSQPAGEDRFESDTQKIIHRHLENKHDVITEEDIRNVRVGMTPVQMDESTEARFEGDDRIDEVEDDLIGNEKEADDKKTKVKRITPWDTIEPEE